MTHSESRSSSRAEFGDVGAEFPERYRGLGLDSISTGIIIEALAMGDINVAYVILLAALNGQIIADHMASDVASEWLPGICRGEILAAQALTDPADRSAEAA